MKNKKNFFCILYFFVIVDNFQAKVLISKDEVKDLEITRETNIILEKITDKVLKINDNLENDKSSNTIEHGTEIETNTKIIKPPKLFQGDIVLTKTQAEDIIDQVVENVEEVGIDVSSIFTEKNRRRKRKMDANMKLTWEFPISYFVEKDVNESQVDIALQLIENETCIKFKKEVKVVPLKPGLRFFADDGCYSHVGKAFSNKYQDVSIGDGCESIGTIQHEVMHALGSYHEQSRPDRDDYLKIYLENVENGEEYNFLRVNFSSSLTFGIKYDYGSDMQYKIDAFSANGKPTMKPYDPLYEKTIGVDSGMSFLDTKLLNIYYCIDKCSNLISCMNGGYQDPNNCTKCKCIDGYIGDDCSQLPPVKKECGDSLRNATQLRKHLHVSGNSDCIYHIKAPKNKTLSIVIKSLEYYPAYETTCTLENSLEVKFLEDKTLTGALFCITEENIVIKSRNDHVIIHHRSNDISNFASIAYQSV